MSDARVSAADLLVLTSLVVLVLAWPLAAPPIGAHGEAREGLVVQDIVRHGRWVLPLRNGAVPSKPPLFHWIAGGIGSVIGLSDAVVRLPSALAVWLALAMVYGLMQQHEHMAFAPILARLDQIQRGQKMISGLIIFA